MNEMRSILSTVGVLLLLQSIAVGGDTVSIDVTNVVARAQGRQAIVEINIPASISISKDATLYILVGVDQKNSPPDEFGPPQNFALKGTSHEITPYRFRVSVALPSEKAVVRLILRDNAQVLVDEKREI